ncbi:MAG: GyrI-like domain-containing protein [Acidobacteriota bacterium]
MSRIASIPWIVVLIAFLIAPVFSVLVEASPARAQDPDVVTKTEIPDPPPESELPQIPPDADDEGYSVQVQQQGTQLTAGIRFQATVAELDSRLAEVLPKVYSYVQEQGLEPGTPYSLYLASEGATLDIEAGVLVDAPVAKTEEILPGSLPQGAAIHTMHPGPYTNLFQAHRALNTWLETHQRRGGKIWELYLTDPGLEPDPRKWRTAVYQSLESEGP